ncbi:GNAT family N-acetyltransferase [Haloarcula onubensis]|uniref:GNAT family N-acetyltransferase n=1 Tax=Haloarcula onubensis TaxID=2950539 RepID=A0ABU2FKB3_9EURY|nr:GNAT family N-acetyltransferase [Halomicroarcula sp. S3CR25-11]MDS0281168.1 GNAT family N-acetyltransferase [Halomicroarcula sp. S3CR25-11]
MELRRARPADSPAIRDVARRSLGASYSLEPQAITNAIEEWYAEDRLATMLSDPDRVLLVADDAGQVVAFSESVVAAANTATLLWLHVDPAHRGKGIATDLFEATDEELERLDVLDLRGRVLAENEAGNAFYQDHGFRRVGTDTVEIDGRSYVENIYAESEQWGREAIDAPDGHSVYVDHDNHERGSLAPFHVVFTTREGDDRYGYFCSNCNTLALAMDSMGRIECETCGNVRKPVRWDAAYL